MISLFKLVIFGLALTLLVFAAEAQTGQKTLRVAFGDHGFIPVQLLSVGDLVWSPKDLGLGTNNPQMRLGKFMDTSKMTPEQLAKRKAEGYNWICYDDEDGQTWPTPKVELADPTKYTILAAKLAHAAGFKFLAEPNFDLLVGHGSHGVNGKLVISDKPLPHVDLKEAGPYLDAISFQLQRAQADDEQYLRLTRQYAAEMRAANPKALVFVQVTSRSKSGKQSTAAGVMPAVSSAAPYVDGIWIHIDTGHDNFAIELIHLMAKDGYRPLPDHP